MIDMVILLPIVGRDIFVGGIFGLVFGFGLALFRLYLTPYIFIWDQVARVASVLVMAAFDGHRCWFWQRSVLEFLQYEIIAFGAEASGALARRELNLCVIVGGSFGALLVVSASPTPNSVGIALAMAEANARDGRETLLVFADIEGMLVFLYFIGYEGLIDLVNELVVICAIRARKLFRFGIVVDLYVLLLGLNHEEIVEVVGPLLVLGIVVDLLFGYFVVIYGLVFVGWYGIVLLVVVVDVLVLVVQVGFDKEMDVVWLIGVLQFVGVLVLGVVLIGMVMQDEMLGILLNYKLLD